MPLKYNVFENIMANGMFTVSFYAHSFCSITLCIKILLNFFYTISEICVDPTEHPDPRPPDKSA